MPPYKHNEPEVKNKNTVLFQVFARPDIQYACRNMDNVGNNTTSFEMVYPSELTYNMGFSANEYSLLGIHIWPIEKCVEAQLTNESRIYVENPVFTYNGTRLLCLEHAPVLTKNTIVRASVLITMAILSLVGNLATIISIKRRRGRGRARPSWTAIYSLIFQLSIADMLVTLFCIIGEAAWSFTVQWYAGNIACKVFKFLQMFALYLSTFVLVLIGVDRWLAVRYPMKSMATATRSGRLIALAWILSVLFSIPQVSEFNIPEFNIKI